MKLSKKGEYALRSLINLGIAAEMKRKLVQVSELAENEQLPVKFLEQILQALKEAGIVESQRGQVRGLPARPAREEDLHRGGRPPDRRAAGADRLRLADGL